MLLPCRLLLLYSQGGNNNIEQTFAKGKGQDDKIEMVSISYGYVIGR